MPPADFVLDIWGHSDGGLHEGVIAKGGTECKRTGKNSVSPATRKISKSAESSERLVSVRGRKMGDAVAELVATAMLAD